MKLNTITIDQLIRLGRQKVIAYQGKVVISDHLGQARLFEEPCRIDALTIVVCLRGRLKCEVNLHRYEMTANSIAVNLPENIVQLHSFEDLEAYIILISADFLNTMPIDIVQHLNAVLSHTGPRFIQVPSDIIRGLLPYYDLIQSSLLRVVPLTDEIARGLLQSFLFSIVGLIAEFQPTSASAQLPPSGAAEGASSRARHQLFDRFMTQLSRYHQQERTVQFYADQLCVSPKYLSTVIRSYSGKSPSDWICSYVIAEAKSLLHYSNLSVQEVAFRLNFPSQSAFGKFFKQKTGISPTEYIRQ